jgi:DNA-binding SARP family transcriptional activator
MPGESKILKISLLGPPLVSFEDQIQTIKRKQTRLLLYFIACQQAPVSRDLIISKFWPNLPESLARKHLREILSNLRFHFSGTDVIVSRYNQISLNPDCTEVDVIRFNQLMNGVNYTLFTMPSGKLPDSIYHDVSEGIALWRTPIFMEGFVPHSPEIEQWISETGSLLQARRQSLVERLVDHDITSGNLGEAIFWLIEALKAEPLKTDLHYLLLTCLRDSGNSVEILKYRDVLSRTYANYGLEVPSILSEFIDRLDESKVKFGSPSAAFEAESLPAMTAFVGRKEILHQLETWSLRGGIVEIRGESGIGKTRTIQEFLNRIDYPRRVLLCAARPMEEALPLQPIIEWVRQVVRKEEWLELLPFQAEALAGLFPEALDLSAKTTNPVTRPEQVSSNRVFEALADLLTLVSRQKRLLVIFDNVQWADETSISLLSFLTNRGMFGRNGFLILSHRVEESNRAAAQFLSLIQSRQNFHSVLIDPLGETEIGEMVYAVMGKEPPAEMVARLKRDVGGMPEFLLQTLKLIMDYSTDMEVLAKMPSYPLARESLAIMRERLKTLDNTRREVLELAAVIGDSFTPELIEDVARVEPESLSGILDELVNLMIFKVDPDVKPIGGYAFTHARMRQALLAALSPARSRTLYSRVIDAMLKRYGSAPSQSARMAQYYEHAGETKKAYQNWLKSAIYARENGLGEAAYASNENALNLVEGEKELFDDGEIRDLISPWVTLALDRTDLETADRLLHQCLYWGSLRKSPLLQGIGHSGLARVMALRKHIDTARLHMDLALKDLAMCPDCVEMIEAVINQGFLYYLNFDFISARETLEKAASMKLNSEDESTSVLRSRALATLSILCSEMGEPIKGDEFAEMSLEGSRWAGINAPNIQGRIAKCLAQFYLENYREAIDISDSVIRDLKSMPSRYWATLFFSVLSRCYLCVGQLDKAWAYGQKMQELVYEFTPIGMETLASGIRGDIFLSLGAVEEAEQEFSTYASQQPNSSYALENQCKLGLIECQKGDFESGLALMQAAFTQASEMDLGMVWLHARAMWLMVSYGQRPTQELETGLKQVFEAASERGLKTLPLQIQLLRFSHSMNPQPALEQYQKLLKKAFSTSNIWLEISIHLQIIELHDVPDEIRQRSRTRLSVILLTLEENSVNDPVKELTRSYVDAVERRIGAGIQ